MAIELSASHPRRAVLAAAGGALAALAAQALGRPLPARAEGEIIHVGDEILTATSRTRIRNGTNNATVLWGESVTGTGVRGDSTSGFGVWGSSGSNTGVNGSSGSGTGLNGSSDSGPGVWGQSSSGSGVTAVNSASDQPAIKSRSAGDNTGVLAFSGSGTLAPASPAKTGLYGYAVQDSGSRGVWGRSNAGFGVYGQATSGRGVRGTAGSGKGGSFQATTGIALHAKGRVQLEQSSGGATIAAGTRSKTVTPGFDLTSSSKVLVTLNGHPGGSTVLQRVAINATANTFTVVLTANAANNTRFAWLVLV